jgi:hypothetical protein
MYIKSGVVRVVRKILLGMGMVHSALKGMDDGSASFILWWILVSFALERVYEVKREILRWSL